MKPLEGLRVLTFEQFGAGPYGSMLLADLGAEVIKVENAATGGDAARHVGPHMLANGDSQYFQTWNMNKKSVALDIKSAEGRAGFEQLVRTADAVMNNLRGDQPEKLGLDHASLRPINPKIVCLHISAYGRDNERKAWPGYDFLMQAEAGVMGLTGEPDGPPTRVGASMVDFMTGATGATGLLACMLRAQKTGTGCDVDICLFDVAMHQLSYAAVWYLNEREASRRQPRSAHLAVAPVQTFPTADGWIFIMCMTEKFWVNFVHALGRPELKADARFATSPLRRQNRDALTELLDGELRKRPTRDWIETFAGLLPVAPVYEMDEALDAAFPRRTGMIRNVPVAERADFLVLGNPLKIDGERPEQVAAPTLGADNDALLGKTSAAQPDATTRVLA
jgi:crotonobetainyl-CoA:carnitine CoA-transferase CaiB-like acyl-CoA transferase